MGKMSDVKPLLNASDFIAKDDFIEYCLKTDLVEAIEKSKKSKGKKTKMFDFLRKKSTEDKKIQEELLRVEEAFKKLDKDGDGYIDWDEFKEVAGANTKIEEVAKIFSACDLSGDQKISLDEFRTMANQKLKEIKEHKKRLKKILTRWKQRSGNWTKMGM